MQSEHALLQQRPASSCSCLHSPALLSKEQLHTSRRGFTALLKGTSSQQQLTQENASQAFSLFRVKGPGNFFFFFSFFNQLPSIYSDISKSYVKIAFSATLFHIRFLYFYLPLKLNNSRSVDVADLAFKIIHLELRILRMDFKAALMDHLGYSRTSCTTLTDDP